jgi:probable HAF family extracellular repeat protein
MTDLGTLPGDSSSYATGINASGQVVGYSGTAGGAQHAFLYSNGMMTDLGTLGGGSSWATGINNGGEVAGYSTIAGTGQFPVVHAFLDSGGVMTDLGALGVGSSYASGVNANGQVVGYSTMANGAYHAFLYSNGVMIDLDSLFPASSERILRQANAINDYGQIAGSGLIVINGQTYGFGFLFNPISLSPNSAVAGGAAFTLTVNGIGTNFVPGATVNWNGTALATTYVSGTRLTASVPAGLIAMPGTASVTVTTTTGTAGVATFGIHPSRGLPRGPILPRDTGQREQQ